MYRFLKSGKNVWMVFYSRNGYLYGFSNFEQFFLKIFISGNASKAYRKWWEVLELVVGMDFSVGVHLAEWNFCMKLKLSKTDNFTH